MSLLFCFLFFAFCYMLHKWYGHLLFPSIIWAEMFFPEIPKVGEYLFADPFHQVGHFWLNPILCSASLFQVIAGCCSEQFMITITCFYTVTNSLKIIIALFCMSSEVQRALDCACQPLQKTLQANEQTWQMPVFSRSQNEIPLA